MKSGSLEGARRFFVIDFFNGLRVFFVRLSRKTNLLGAKELAEVWPFSAGIVLFRKTRPIVCDKPFFLSLQFAVLLGILFILELAAGIAGYVLRTDVS